MQFSSRREPASPRSVPGWSIIRRRGESGKQGTPVEQDPCWKWSPPFGGGQSSGPTLVFAEPRGPVLNWFLGLISTNRVTVPPRPWTASKKSAGMCCMAQGHIIVTLRLLRWL